MIDTPLARHWFMHTAHAAVGLAAAAKQRTFQAPPPPLPTAEPRETRTLRIGLIAGAEAAWDLAAAQLIEHLRNDERLEVRLAWDGAESGIEDRLDYDCLVLLGWPAATSRERLKRIELHVRGGGSLVALRAMHAELPGWSSFAEDVFGGRQPSGNRCRLHEVDRSDSAWHHPVLDGVRPMIAEGEVYEGPRFSPETNVLLMAYGDDQPRPVAWTRRHRGGRVVASTLGVDDDFREPNFLHLLGNAIHWAGLVRGSAI